MKKGKEHLKNFWWHFWVGHYGLIPGIENNEHITYQKGQYLVSQGIQTKARQNQRVSSFFSHFHILFHSMHFFIFVICSLIFPLMYFSLMLSASRPATPGRNVFSHRLCCSPIFHGFRACTVFPEVPKEPSINLPLSSISIDANNLFRMVALFHFNGSTELKIRNGMNFYCTRLSFCSH